MRKVIHYSKINVCFIDRIVKVMIGLADVLNVLKILYWGMESALPPSHIVNNKVRVKINVLNVFKDINLLKITPVLFLIADVNNFRMVFVQSVNLVTISGRQDLGFVKRILKIVKNIVLKIGNAFLAFQIIYWQIINAYWRV